MITASSRPRSVPVEAESNTDEVDATVCKPTVVKIRMRCQAESATKTYVVARTQREAKSVVSFGKGNIAKLGLRTQSRESWSSLEKEAPSWIWVHVDNHIQI